MAIAKTATEVNPFAKAASFIMVAATIPPVRGGNPEITYSLPARGIAINQHNMIIPAKPARVITTTFH